jgi:hypothetical protein
MFGHPSFGLIDEEFKLFWKIPGLVFSGTLDRHFLFVLYFGLPKNVAGTPEDSCA